MEKKIKLLFITQKIHEKDDDLAFVILWIKEFIKQDIDVQVICLEKGDFDGSFSVYSLGKEKGISKLMQAIKFFRLIMTLKYNRVFVHMNMEYVTLGGWYWFLMKKPLYLWYTHYTMHVHLWLAGIFSKRMFAATSQSLPQYNNSSKKVVTGHGIDIEYWLSDGLCESPDISIYNLVSVHRICRSKRLEIGIRALKFLPQEYNLSIYGRDVEKDYYGELQSLVKNEGLQDRVSFIGPVPMDKLKKIYLKFQLMINMASETIDKTVLEGMVFGIYPITTIGNTRAIGLDVYPLNETPKAIAEFILSKKWERYNKEQLLDIVRKKHSLPSLIEKMNKYIKYGK